MGEPPISNEYVYAEACSFEVSDELRPVLGQAVSKKIFHSLYTQLLLQLRIIDVAIQQSLAALESAPLSLPLQQAVMTSYERKLDFLRQAAAITAEG